LLTKIVENLINIIDIFHQNRIVKYFMKQTIDIVIDVGAHKGEYLKKIRKIKPSKIYAFEPQKKIFQQLKVNTKIFKEVKIFNYACNDKDIKQTFFINSLTSTSSLLKPNENNWWIKFKKFILQKNSLIETMEVIKTKTLDSIIFKELDPYSKILIKIDTEGNELNVLKGSKKILQKRNVLFIQVEVAKNEIYESNNSEKLEAFLNKQGYFKCKSFLYPMLNFSDDIYRKKG